MTFAFSQRLSQVGKKPPVKFNKEGTESLHPLRSGWASVHLAWEGRVQGFWGQSEASRRTFCWLPEEWYSLILGAPFMCASMVATTY